MAWRPTTSRAILDKRLSGYWRLELANVVLVPVLTIILAMILGARPGVLTIIAIPANVVLLAVGGLYWRAKLHRISGQPETLRELLPTIDRLQVVSQLLTFLALLAAVVGWAAPALSRGRGDQVLTTVFAVLALAEYVNYYHRQLQHFDHTPDFFRLLKGRGFRRSHLAVDLARWRATHR